MEYFEWYSVNPAASPVLTFKEEPYVLRNYENLGNTLLVPQALKGPFQIGQSFINVDVTERSLSISLRIVASSLEELYSLKNELSKAMVIEPTTGLNPPGLGTLRYYRDGQEPLELLCCPRESPQFTEIPGAIVCDGDLEFVAFSPYWQEISDTSIALAGSPGGFQFALQFPFESLLASSMQVITNGGDVSTPICARVYGSLTTFRLINDTTDQTLEVTGTINANEYLELCTGYGEKYLVYVNSAGIRTDVFNRLALGSVFWQLQPGVNQIRFEADTLTTGNALIWWRERFSGV